MMLTTTQLQKTLCKITDTILELMSSLETEKPFLFYMVDPKCYPFLCTMTFRTLARKPSISWAV